MSRYDSEDIGIAIQLESILSFRADKTDISTVCEFYEGDICLKDLERELDQFIVTHVYAKCPVDCFKVFANNRTLVDVFPNLARLARIYLSLPCTTCEAERTFSALRRLKTYLRSTMSQRRLNSCSILNVHSEMVDKINMETMIAEWIGRNTERINAFRY